MCPFFLNLFEVIAALLFECNNVKVSHSPKCPKFDGTKVQSPQYYMLFEVKYTTYRMV